MPRTAARLDKRATQPLGIFRRDDPKELCQRQKKKQTKHTKQNKCQPPTTRNAVRPAMKFHRIPIPSSSSTRGKFRVDFDSVFSLPTLNLFSFLKSIRETFGEPESSLCFFCCCFFVVRFHQQKSSPSRSFLREIASRFSQDSDGWPGFRLG